MIGFDATGFQKVLYEVSEKLGCDPGSDPHVLLLEVDDELFRFMLGWQTVDRALQAIVPGFVRRCCSPGALDMATLANVVCNSSVADGDNVVNGRASNAWLNAQFGHVMSAETYQRLHAPEKLSKPVVESVSNLLNVFRVPTVKAFKTTVAVNLNHDDHVLRWPYRI
jgi:hypothetical protein